MGGTSQSCSRGSEKVGKPPAADMHYVLGTPMKGPWPASFRLAILANGCFWGAEKGLWRLPGVHSTAVGYAAGRVENPTYEQVCSGRTGATEATQVVYDPAKISMADILRWFWQSHDPTTLNAQGGDRGTQYRSGLYYFDEDQRQLCESSAAAYGAALSAAGKGLGSSITTEIRPASDFSTPFYYAEDYHQQYLAKPDARPYCSAQPQGVAVPPYEQWVPRDWSAEKVAEHAPRLLEAFWNQHSPKEHSVIRADNMPISMP